MKKFLQFKKASVILSVCVLSLISVKNSNAQNLAWVKGMGGNLSDVSQAITLDATGNVYTTGSFEGTADFDPGAGTFNLTSSGTTDIFVSKLDVNGNFVWAKKMGGVNLQIGNGIKVDAAGNVYTTGYFVGVSDFDPGAGTFTLSAIGAADIFVSKLDASGNFVWAKQMGGLSNDYGYSIALDASGNVYTAGDFEGTVDFDPAAPTFSLTSFGVADIFVSKLDANGNFVWAKQMGSPTNDNATCLTVDAAGNVYTSGSFANTADFDPSAATYSLTSINSFDVFISKLDVNGNFVWAKQIGGLSGDSGQGINIDGAGNVYTTGYFQGIADFDPSAATYTLISGGQYDIFISKLDATGNFVWAKSIGATGYDVGLGITTDATGNVFTAGYFSGSVDFDPGVGTSNLIAIGNFDIYVNKLDASGNFIWAKSIGSNTVSCSSYGITSDAVGNIYTTGFYSGVTDFDPNAGIFTLTPSGTQSDVFVLKLNSLSTGVIETKMGVEATIYPNPASSALTIKTKEIIETIYVYNVLGAIVMEEKSNSFSVEQLPTGIYTIQIKTVNGIGTTRFIKE